MEQILLPSTIEIKHGKEPNVAELIIEPCYQGYGTTIGNALRRVLLSSMSGAAVTAMKIKGANHEFTAIPNIKEDAIQIMLNLKQLRMRVHSSEPMRLRLYAKGEKVATAKDIEPNAQVEIINSDLPIAQITSEDAELDMEIFVEQGRGYLSAEEKPKRGLEVGVIAIDSVFTPIRNVGFKVENVRVGQITNFDRLVMRVETDGTVDPKEMIKQAARLLIDHFSSIESIDKSADQDLLVKTETETEQTEEVTAPKGAEEIIESEPEKPAKRGRKKNQEAV